VLIVLCAKSSALLFDAQAVMQEGMVCNGVVAESEQQAVQIWKIREGISEALPHFGGSKEKTPKLHRHIDSA